MSKRFSHQVHIYGNRTPPNTGDQKRRERFLERDTFRSKQEGVDGELSLLGEWCRDKLLSILKRFRSPPAN